MSSVPKKPEDAGDTMLLSNMRSMINLIDRLRDFKLD